MIDKEKIVQLLESNSFPMNHGLKLDDITEDRIQMHVDLEEYMKNPYGMAHGGMYFLIQDTAAGLLSRGDGRRYVTLDAHISFLASIWKGRMLAQGDIVRRGKSTCIVKTQVTDEDGNLMSMATVTMFCLEPEKEKE